MSILEHLLSCSLKWGPIFSKIGMGGAPGEEGEQTSSPVAPPPPIVAPLSTSQFKFTFTFAWSTNLLKCLFSHRGCYESFLILFFTEAGNYYSNPFIMTLIKQDNLVFILVILYIREYFCVFIKLFTLTGNQISKDFQFRVCGFLK